MCHMSREAQVQTSCALGVTDYYKQEFLKGVAQGGAGGSSRAPTDDATSSIMSNSIFCQLKNSHCLWLTFTPRLTSSFSEMYLPHPPLSSSLLCSSQPLPESSPPLLFFSIFFSTVSLSSFPHFLAFWSLFSFTFSYSSPIRRDTWIDYGPLEPPFLWARVTKQREREADYSVALIQYRNKICPRCLSSGENLPLPISLYISSLV